MVINQKGEIWKAYGDGSLQKSQPDRIVEAVYLSLQEVFDAYSNGKAFELNALALIKNVKALALIPITYSTDLKKYLPDS